MLGNMVQVIGDLSQAELLELKVPGSLEDLTVFEMLVNFLQTINIGCSGKANLPQDMKGDDAHIQHLKNADTGLCLEAYGLQQWKLVKERIFPSLFGDFAKFPSFAKFICLRRFAAMAQLEFSPAFLRDVENSILGKLFYKLTLIMFKDALGDEASVGNFPLGKVLAEKVRENDIDGNDATSESFFLETCIKFWCSLPAMPPNRLDSRVESSD